MTLTLRYYGDRILRRPASAVRAVTSETRAFVEAMFACMYEAEGIGLAAPQVGSEERIFVVDITEGGERVKRAFLNPVLVEREGTSVGEEGCLSIPGIRGDVIRAARVLVEALDEHGSPFRLEAEGLLARAIQHEHDHLDGILFVDRLSPIQRKLIEAKLKRFKPPAEAPARDRALSL